jgi:hypothetical protein
VCDRVEREECVGDQWVTRVGWRESAVSTQLVRAIRDISRAEHLRGRSLMDLGRLLEKMGKVWSGAGC